jgi:hypothetical protein
MPNILAHDPIRALPIYQAGLSAGADIGLRIALDALTAERSRQERLMADDAGSDARRVYAGGVLLDVARAVGAVFRQETR